MKKNKRIGGKVNILEASDYRFNLNATHIMTPKVFQEIFADVNRDYRDYLDFKQINPMYRSFYENGSKLDFPNNIVQLLKNLESISMKESLGYMTYLADVYKKHLIVQNIFATSSQNKPTDFFNANSLAHAFKSNPFSTSYTYIKKYVHSDKLRKFLTYLSFFSGISPYRSPNYHTIVPGTFQLYGLWHLEGGMYSYIQALEKLVQEMGGTIKRNTEVKEILTQDNKAVGVKTDKYLKQAKVVICNADFPYAMKKLIKDKDLKGKYAQSKACGLDYTCSVFNLYLGLKKQYPNLAVHNFFLGNNFKENVHCVFKGNLPTNPSLYIHCASKVDKTVAPKNKETLYVIVRVPNLLKGKNINWDEKTVKLIRQRVIGNLKKVRGLEDIEQSIDFEQYLTPIDIRDRFNRYAGAAYGLCPTISQTNYFRPHVKSPTIKNLYFVGDSVHPGVGVSMVLLSSKLAVEQIEKDLSAFKV